MRSASLYTGMLATLAGGIWVILRAGAELRPPTDVSGRWEACEGEERSFEIRQSGQFLQLRVDGGAAIALKWRAAGEDAGAALGEMVGADVRLSLRELESRPGGAEPAATHELESHGALEGSWPVRRAGSDAPRDGSSPAAAGAQSSPVSTTR